MYVCMYVCVCVCMFIVYLFIRIISYTSSDQPSINNNINNILKNNGLALRTALRINEFHKKIVKNKIENINIYKSIKVEKVKERISKLQSTMKGFEYDEVIHPLSISFKNMYMTLKSNGNRVDYNSGVLLSACL